jgi:outer membrane protein W
LKTKRTTADVLTELLDVDGIRVVADRHLWDRPDTVALRHDFASNTPFQLYCAAGIDRAVYLDSRALSPSSALSARRQRSVGMMAEVGASWRLTGQLNVETDIHWMDLTRDTRLMRTDAGWVSGDPVTLTLSLVWRGK